MMMRRATDEFAVAVTSVFWNIDTCPVPLGFDPRRFGPCMKRYLEKLCYTGPLTMCVFGTLTDVPDQVLRAVSSTGFLVYIDPYGTKSLSGYMFQWAGKKNPPPANLMVITHSTDRDTAINLRMLQGEGYNIIRPYPLGPASSTNAWSGALEKDYPIETVESSWVCTVCDDLTGRGFDNFTTHISSQGHAYQRSRWFSPAAPEDEEEADVIAVKTRVEPWDWSPALESQPPPPPLPLHRYAPQSCAGCNVTILPQPWESFPFVCHRCATTILPKPPHWFAPPSESHGEEPKLANQSLVQENQMQIDDPRDEFEKLHKKMKKNWGWRIVQRDKDREEAAKTASKKLLHEFDVLQNRLQECNVKFHIEEESKLIMESSSPSEAIELLAASDNRISLLIAETQLLSEEVEKLKLTTSDDNPGTDYVVRKMLTEVLIDNARLRKQVNSVLRCSLSGQY